MVFCGKDAPARASVSVKDGGDEREDIRIYQSFARKHHLSK